MATNDWKVDIINISLGYSGYVSELRCIQHEIMRAYSRGILVFCAAGNPGGNDNIAYPASMRTVICVNSANGEGLPSASNPPADLQDNFAILGEEIPIGSATGIQRVTGTSFASPIAAGLCAFIIRFLREAKGFPREQREDNEYLLKNCQGIRAVFLVMSSEIQGFDYIRPWELFKGNNKDRTVWHIQHALETLKAH